MKKSPLKEVIESPAIFLDATTNEISRIEKKITNKSLFQRSKEYLSNVGPGLVSGAADDDPSGIATYSQVGAQFGFTFLWISLWTFPLMATIQEMCARIALVTGRGLAANIKHSYSKKVLSICTILLFIANTLNIGADLGAMATATQLIFPTMKFTFIVISLGFVGLLLQVFIPYQQYAKYLKWLALTLLSYIVTGFIIQLDWQVIWRNAFIPKMYFTKEAILLVVGVLGTTISPYLFFWQTSQEVEDEIAQGKVTVKSRQGTTETEIKKMRFDVWSGMLLSNIVMFFIIAVCAATLFSNGITHITSASEAALALKPLAGNGAYFLFALGIIGTGMLAIPVLAGSTAYAISESMNWKEGLYRKLREAYAFYGIIIISVSVGIVINFIGIDPIKALIYSAIANALIAPVILVCIVQISSDHKVMGSHTNSKLGKIFGWSVIGIMTLAAIAALVSFFL